MSKFLSLIQIFFLSLVLVGFVAFVFCLMLSSFTVGEESVQLTQKAAICVLACFTSMGMAFVTGLIEEKLQR